MNSAETSYRWLFWTLALLGLAADQASKYGVFYELYPDRVPWPPGYQTGYKAEVSVVPDVFELLAQFTTERDQGTGIQSYLRTLSAPELPYVNRGALFGKRFWLSEDIANTMFAVISIVAALGIVLWSTRQQTGHERFLCISLGLILAGTLGNFYDRVVFGGVRDFLHWYYWIDWPVFNVADCCLVCGAGLLLLQAFFTAPEQQPVEKSAKTEREPVVAQAS